MLLIHIKNDLFLPPIDQSLDFLVIVAFEGLICGWQWCGSLFTNLLELKSFSQDLFQALVF
jgi:hypothetical protein